METPSQDLSQGRLKEERYNNRWVKRNWIRSHGQEVLVSLGRNISGVGWRKSLEENIKGWYSFL